MESLIVDFKVYQCLQTNFVLLKYQYWSPYVKLNNVLKLIAVQKIKYLCFAGDKTTLQPEQVSTAIIATIAVIGLLLLIAAVVSKTVKHTYLFII